MATSRLLRLPIPMRLSTGRRHPFSSTTTNKKSDPTGMDVGAWSWQWKAGGGAAVAVFTPWACLKLLQVSAETREDLEKVMPSLVQWVRENYGFEDEDEELRLHNLSMSLMYSEPVTVSYPLQGARLKEFVSGTTTCKEIKELFNQKACGKIDETLLEIEDLKSLQKDPLESVNSSSHQKSIEIDPLIVPLNHMRSLWDNESLSFESVSDILGKDQVEKRQLIEDIVGVLPISPFISKKNNTSLHYHTRKSDHHINTKATNQSERSTSASFSEMNKATPSSEIEKTLHKKLAVLESELKSGLSGREIDLIEQDIAVVKQHIKNHNRSLRPWAFWI